MKPFPWGLLTLALLALDLLLTGFYLLRKRLAKWYCHRLLAQGKLEDLFNFLMAVRSEGLISLNEFKAWKKEFGLEDK